MTISRRSFLKGAALSTLAPAWLDHPWVRRALAETIGDRYLVVMFLDGGNDGINTVTPYDDGGNAPASAAALRSQYERARHTGSGGLRLDVADLLVPDGTTGGPALVDAHTGCQLGFHPALAGLRALYDQDLVAVVQGCGYPAYFLSHDQSRFAWETANPLHRPEVTSAGWIGRHLIDPAGGGYGPTDIPALTLGGLIAPELRQSGTGVVSVLDTLGDITFPYGPGTASTAAYDQLYRELNARAELRGDPWTHLATIGSAAVRATQMFPQADAAYEADRPAMSAAYGAARNGVALGLRETAKIIYGNEQGLLGGAPPRFFQLQKGGFDSHADQGGAATSSLHYGLLSHIAHSLEVFFDDLASLGAGGADVRDKVLVLIWSEFGRRVMQNDNGSDHGSQAPVFVIGGAVHGGIYGNYPDLQFALDVAEDGNTPYSQDDANGFRSTDFRDVYGAILKHWVNLTEAQILAPTMIPADGASYDPYYWTAPRFDLGFL